jgi:hypothetical protein
MTSEKTGSSSSNLDAMKEYLGIEGYAAFLDCIKEHIGSGPYQNEKEGDNYINNNNNNDDDSVVSEIAKAMKLVEH